MAFISWSDITPVQSNREKETENHKEWYVREKLLLNVKWLLVQQDYALKVHVATSKNYFAWDNLSCN